MLGNEVENGTNRCVTIIESQQRQTTSLQQLIDQGVPVRQDKYSWSGTDIQKLKDSVLKLQKNTENPPRPPTKSVLKYIRENVFPGFGPSEDQIRRKLMALRYFNSWNKTFAKRFEAVEAEVPFSISLRCIIYGPHSGLAWGIMYY